jgi:hypothetical protein
VSERRDIRSRVLVVLAFGVTLVAVGAGCSGGLYNAVSSPPAPVAATFAHCAVTVAAAGVPDEVVQGLPVVAEDAGWYGNDAVWVSLPPQGVLPSLRTEEMRLATKFPWWRVRPRRLQVRTESIEGGRAFRGSVPDGYGDLGFTPSGLVFDRIGCWRVAGTLDDTELSFVVWVCETDDYEVDNEERQACGAA